MEAPKTSFLSSRKFIIIAVVTVSVVAVILLAVGYVLLRGDNGLDDSNTDTTSESNSASDSNSENSESSEPEVDAEISIVDYPSTIATSCDVLSFTVSVKNVGEKALQYSDVTNGTYNFSIVVEDTSAWNSSRGMNVSNFGSIQVGETKEITFTGGETLSAYGVTSYHENNFHGPDDNGTFEMRVRLNKPYAENRFLVLGESDPVNITINIYEDPTQNLLKSCGGV